MDQKDGGSGRSHEVGSTGIDVTSLTILLVDAVSTDRDLACHVLGRLGHAVDVVGDGTEAVMAVQDVDYDVVFMDMQMPHLDGPAATRMIRALPHRCCDVPIVAMTTNILPEQTAAARRAGMDDVIRKPFSGTEVLAVLDRVVGVAHRGTRETQGGAGGDYDRAVLGRLAALLGDAKVRGLLEGLIASLCGRFDGDPATPEGREILRRGVHASVAGSGMLGFTAFSTRCRTFGTATDEDFAERLAALKRDADSVIATARRLAEQTGSLMPATAA